MDQQNGGIEGDFKAKMHRRRAVKIRASLDGMADLENRRMAASIADAYETLAKAEECMAFGPDLRT